MASVKSEYASSAAFTITLTSLATSSTLLVGRESTAIDNTSNKYLSAKVGGKITTGTTTANTVIEIWVYGQVEDTPLYPDVIDGTDSDETFAVLAQKQSALRLLHVIGVPDTTARTYWFGPIDVCSALGWQRLPKRWGLFVTHNTGANLDADSGDHAIYYTPEYETVA